MNAISDCDIILAQAHFLFYFFYFLVNMIYFYIMWEQDLH